MDWINKSFIYENLKRKKIRINNMLSLRIPYLFDAMAEMATINIIIVLPILKETYLSTHMCNLRYKERQIWFLDKNILPEQHFLLFLLKIAQNVGILYVEHTLVCTLLQCMASHIHSQLFTNTNTDTNKYFLFSFSKIYYCLTHTQKKKKKCYKNGLQSMFLKNMSGLLWL